MTVFSWYESSSWLNDSIAILHSDRPHNFFLVFFLLFSLFCFWGKNYLSYVIGFTKKYENWFRKFSVRSITSAYLCNCVVCSDKFQSSESSNRLYQCSPNHKSENWKKIVFSFATTWSVMTVDWTFLEHILKLVEKQFVKRIMKRYMHNFIFLCHFLIFCFFFLNQKYQKVCSVCDNAISGTFYEKDGKFTCAECYKVRPKKSFSKKKTQIFYWKCLLEN